MCHFKVESEKTCLTDRSELITEMKCHSLVGDGRKGGLFGLLVKVPPGT